jgi:peptidoglycan hydrolase CwlO-like protein
MIFNPLEVTGEVKPIEEANQQLEGITREEEETLDRLFILTQEIEEMERQEARLSQEIASLIIHIDELDKSIAIEEKNYGLHLDIMEQVLISYQRGGPASYLDILLKAENLTSFIKSLNLIKDITRNTGELLASIEESKKFLEENRQNLYDSKAILDIRQEELMGSIANKKSLLMEQEAYLESLSEEREKYQQHLDNLKLMWDNLKNLFSHVVDEFSRIIAEGHFTMEDLNLKFGLFSVKGSIHEDTFNRIINENSLLTEMVFSFQKDRVVVEVPDNNLVLYGHFVLEANTSLRFVPEGGSFYSMSLEIESINELFRNGPMLIDFEKVAGDLVVIDIDLKDVVTEDGYISFTIETGFLF